MDAKVFLCGPITGQSGEGFIEWRIKARDAFLASGATAVDVAMLVNSGEPYRHRGQAAMVG